MIDLKKLIDGGVQYGHQTWRWSPRMRQYIWGKKNGVHLIDISKTAAQLEKATQFLEQVASEGRQVLWVGTKKAAQDVINETADRLGCARSTHRWVGGTLTNFSQVKKSVTKLLHFEDIVNKADKALYTKKELGTYQKVVARLCKSVGGVRGLTWPVGALIVIDAKKEATAIKEAAVMGVPVVALVDTNSDPSGVTIVIPGNDDVARSIKVIVEELAAAVERGIAIARERKAAAPAIEHSEGEGNSVDEVLANSLGEDEEDSADHRAPRPQRRAQGRAGAEGGLIAPERRGGNDRGPRRRTDRGSLPEGQGFAPRPEGEGRPPRREFGPRPEGDNRGPRREFGPRPDGQARGPRPDGEHRGPRREYGPRPEGDNRGPRREFGPRPEGDNRGPRREYGPRPEGDNRGPRPEGEHRGPRREFGPRPDGEHRGPRREYGPRPEGDNRGPRPEGEHRGPRREYGPRPEGDNRGPRREFGPRPDGERRGPRREFGPRPDGQSRGPRPEGDNRGPRREGVSQTEAGVSAETKDETNKPS